MDRTSQVATFDMPIGQDGSRLAAFDKIKRLTGVEQASLQQGPKRDALLLAGIFADQNLSRSRLHRFDTRLCHPDVFLIALDPDPVTTEFFRHCAGCPRAEEWIKHYVARVTARKDY